MHPASAQTGTKVRRLWAVALALWLSGAGCLLCCGDEARAATPRACESAAAGVGAVKERQAVTGRRTYADASSSSGDSCCKARVPVRRRVAGRHLVAREDARARTQVSRACCERSRQTLDAARRPRLMPKPTAAAAGAAGVIVSAPAVAAHAAPPVARSRLPDRGGTHLRVCVFLI